MTEKQIEDIVKQIVQRIELIVSDKRALVINGEEHICEALDKLQNSLKADGYIFSQVSPDSVKDGKKLVSAHDIVIVAGLKISQLTALRDLDIRCGKLSLIYEAVRQGKKVYLLSEDLALNAAPLIFKAEVFKLTNGLEKWGIHFPQMPEDFGRKIEKSLVTMQDVSKLGEGAIIVGPETQFVSAAIKYLRDKNIEIIRR